MTRGPQKGPRCFAEKLERETGFEPATSTLARSHSTTELFPLEPSKHHHSRTERKPFAASPGGVGLIYNRVPHSNPAPRANFAIASPSQCHSSVTPPLRDTLSTLRL